MASDQKKPVFIWLSPGWGGPPMRSLIDRDDYERVSRHEWKGVRHLGGVYAHHSGGVPVASHQKTLAGFILGIDFGQMVDHINGDTLDNRKSNLRLATRVQNAQNATVPAIEAKTSRFKGVSMSGRRWRAAITANGESYEIGLFDREDEAAAAYDRFAVRLHKEFARTNAMLGLFGNAAPVTPNCLDFVDTYATLGRQPRKKRYSKSPESRKRQGARKKQAFLDRELEKWGFDPDEFRAQQRAK